MNKEHYRDVARAQRESNIELFRIITMLLIVAHHYVVNSGLMDYISEDIVSGPSIFLLLFGAWGKIGINCFIMITGYFMCKQNITVKKFLQLILELYFYKILIWAIFFLTGYEQYSFIQCLKVFLPFTSISQNFTGCYLMFFLYIPFLNILINNMDKKQHIRLIVLSVFIYVILGTCPGINVVFNYVTWYIVVYFIASYIRLYPNNLFRKTKLWGGITAVCIVLSSLSVVACTWVYDKLEIMGHYYFVADCNKILAITTAISAFLFFKNIHIPNSRIINTIAASTFGVLLIHANGDTMRRWLWKDILKNTKMYSSPWLVSHAIFSVLVVYIVCTAIDFIRRRFIEKAYLDFSVKIYENIRSYISRRYRI